jgi:RNA polymerase sigma factor (sigma-70 family)
VADGRLRAILRHLREAVVRQQGGALDDAQLLERFVAAHDEAAFEVLVWRHGELVWNVCRRVLRHEQDAEDAFQATFLALARKAASIGRRAAVAAWLYKVAYRAALAARAAAVNRARREAPLVDLPAPGPPPGGGERDLWAVLEEEVNRLPDKYRLPFVLCCLEGKSGDEAAEYLGCPRATVGTRLSRARERLRARLSRRGVAFAAALAAASLTGRAASAALTAGRVKAAVSAALAFAAGRAAPGAPPTPAAALAEAVLRSLLVARLKAARALLALALLAAGAGVLARPSPAPDGQEAAGADLAPPAPGSERARAAARAQARRDQFGDPLPPGAIARLGTVRWRAGEWVHLLAGLPDGKTLLSVSGSGTNAAVVTLWDLATGATVARSEDNTVHLLGLRLTQVALSADGKVLAAAGGGLKGGAERVFLWEVTPGRPPRPRPALELKAASLALSPDGKVLAAAGLDKVLRLWDLTTGAELRRCAGEEHPWTNLAFSPDGHTLVSWKATGGVRWWDTASGAELPPLGPARGANAVAFSPDGKLLATAAAGEKAVRLWDLATRQEARRWETGADSVCLAFSPEGQALAAAGGMAPAAAPGGGAVRVWDVATGMERWRSAGHRYGASALAFSADGKALASGGPVGPIRLWDAANGQDLAPFPAHEGWVSAVAFAPGGRALATGGVDGTIRLWEPATGRPVSQFGEGPPQNVMGLAFSADGRSLVSAERGLVRVWRPATGREERRLTGHAGAVVSLTLSPDGRTVAAGGRNPKDKVVRLWDLTTGEELPWSPVEPGHVFTVAFSPDGRAVATAVGAADRAQSAVRLRDVATGKVLRQWPAAQPGPVAFSPDGRVLAGVETWGLVGAERALHFWDLATGAERRCPAGQQTTMTCLAFSPDGRVLAWGGPDGRVVLWEVTTEQVRCRFEGHQSEVSALAFAPDGKTLASASNDGTALVWDLFWPGAGGSGRGPRRANK